MLWTTALKERSARSRGPRGEAEGGMYSAVGLSVFQVDSLIVIDAVKSASEQRRKAEVLDLARRCRDAPELWRD